MKGYLKCRMPEVVSSTVHIDWLIFVYSTHHHLSQSEFWWRIKYLVSVEKKGDVEAEEMPYPSSFCI